MHSILLCPLLLSASSLFFFFFALPRGGVPRMQMVLSVDNPELSEVLPLKSRVGQSTWFTCRQEFCLFYLYFSEPFIWIIPSSLPT